MKYQGSSYVSSYKKVLLKTVKYILEQKYLSLFSAFACVIILPVYVHYLPPFMILWGLAWLAENKLKFSRAMISNNKASVLFALFMVLYIWQISELFMADSFAAGFERIFKRLSFLLFPLVLFYPGERILSNIKLILRIFALSTMAYAIFCLGDAFYESINISHGIVSFNPHPVMFDYENYFFSDRLTFPAHPTYIAIYTVMSLIITMDTVSDRSLGSLKRILWTGGMLLLFVFIYLLSSKAGFLAAGISIIGFLIKIFHKKISLFMTIILVVFVTATLLLISRQNTRINYFLESLSNEQMKKAINEDIRLNIWRSALSVIKNKPVLGVGTGNASEELKKEFISKGYNYGFYDNMNAHNQFLEILLENGIIGMALFLLLIGYIVYSALINHNFILGMFIVIMVLFFFFETILNRLAGITFFPLFSFLLLSYPKRIKEG